MGMFIEELNQLKTKKVCKKHKVQQYIKPKKTKKTRPVSSRRSEKNFQIKILKKITTNKKKRAQSAR